MGGGTTILSQQHFRYRSDDGGELGATYPTAIDEQIATGQPGAKFRLRFAFGEIGGKAARNAPFTIISRVNGGAWTEPTEPTSPIVYFDSTHIVGETSTTQQISAPDTFGAGQMIDVNVTPLPQTILANTTTEWEFAFELSKSGYGSVYQDDDLIEVGVAFGDMTLLNQYDIVPQFNVAPLTKFSDIHLGGQQINEFYFGSALVPNIYLGSQEVYRNA